METRDPIELLFDLCEQLALHECNDEYIPLLLWIKEELDASYMRLPLDADGMLIRPGDVVEDCESGYRFMTTKLFLCKEGWAVHGRRPDELRHVKTDTVESLLHRFGYECMVGKNTEESVAEYAERIRKAVEHEVE